MSWPEKATTKNNIWRKPAPLTPMIKATPREGRGKKRRAARGIEGRRGMTCERRSKAENCYSKQKAAGKSVLTAEHGSTDVINRSLPTAANPRCIEGREKLPQAVQPPVAQTEDNKREKNHKGSREAVYGLRK